MIRRAFLLLAALPFFLCANSAFAQQAKAKAPAKKAASNPAYAQIQDEPGLPRVLLIGDSISIGYTLAVRDELKGKANVHRPATNCGPTIRGLGAIDAWLGNGKWDVIHFNFGLHDVRLMEDKHQVSAADYEKHLQTLIDHMKKTGAKLIFATTTPVPKGAALRNPGDEVKYNEIALRVMKKNDIAIDDLYAFALPKLAEIQLPANVHFTPAGSKVLAKQVAQSIAAALPKAK